jgi:hypothetical protein
LVEVVYKTEPPHRKRPTLARMQRQLCTYRPAGAPRYGFWWATCDTKGDATRRRVLRKLAKGELGPRPMAKREEA